MKKERNLIKTPDLNSVLATIPAGIRVPFVTNRATFAHKNTAVLGILNCTPDSFFDGGQNQTEKQAIAKVQEYLQWGVDGIDVGGESSRPGAEPVSIDEEKKRVLPVIRYMRSHKEFDRIPISIDTVKSEVARAALGEGADIINDISALNSDPNMMNLVIENKTPVILNHMQGNPSNMQKAPKYQNVLQEVMSELAKTVNSLRKLGHKDSQICVDPGIGFGKRLEDNYALIWNIAEFSKIGCSTLLGMSRKSYIGMTSGLEQSDRLIPSVSSAVLAVLAGVSMLRVHDVKETMEAIKMVEAIRSIAGMNA